MQFDVNDAWSRFHHLQNILETAHESFCPNKIDASDWDDILDDLTMSPEEARDFKEGWIESQIIERDIAHRLFLQTMVASIYATYEYSFLTVLSAFQIKLGAAPDCLPRPGMTLRSKSVLSALSTIGHDPAESDVCFYLEISRLIRNSVMHRGGLEPTGNSGDLKEYLREHPQVWSVQFVSFADGKHSEQIDVSISFVRELLAVAKDSVDALHNDCVKYLRKNGVGRCT